MTISEQNTILADALKNILYPVEYLSKAAGHEGNELLGLVAVELSNDSEFLKSIAREALNKVSA